MTDRPSLKEQLRAQRAASAEAQKSSVADTFRKDSEPRVRTSMYLSESLSKRLKIQAAEEGRRVNDVVVEALERYLDKPHN